MTFEEMQQNKLASCPVCNELNDYSAIKFNDQMNCKACGTVILLARIDGIVLFLRHGWT